MNLYISFIHYLIYDLLIEQVLYVCRYVVEQIKQLCLLFVFVG